MEQKRFIISKSFGNENNAGSKAPDDIIHITEKMGFQPLFIRQPSEKNASLTLGYKIRRQISYYHQWSALRKAIPQGSMILLQNMDYRETGDIETLQYLHNSKHVKIICFIHDINELRSDYNTQYLRRHFREVLKVSDQIIIHNSSMQQYMQTIGVPEEKLIILQIFDYLLPSVPENHTVSFGDTDPCSVIIAGNLDSLKSAYLAHLKELQDVHFRLYGSNLSDNIKSGNITYAGSFQPDEIPYHLNGRFGLVWDGTSINTCDGITGRYLRYNNPHKLSLYLAAGIPVIVWTESAVSSFVLSHHVGYAVSDLHDLGSLLSSISESEYEQCIQNIREIQRDLISGYYTKKAVQCAMDNLMN